jgi:hypothetical protein
MSKKPYLKTYSVAPGKAEKTCGDVKEDMRVLENLVSPLADRHWPDNMPCLMLKSARIIPNPTGGFRGAPNTAVMRARDNGMLVCFAHPWQSLICGAKCKIAVGFESCDPDVFVHEVALTQRALKAKGTDSMHFKRSELYEPIVEKEATS